MHARAFAAALVTPPNTISVHRCRINGDLTNHPAPSARPSHPLLVVVFLFGSRHVDRRVFCGRRLAPLPLKWHALPCIIHGLPCITMHYHALPCSARPSAVGISPLLACACYSLRIQILIYGHACDEPAETECVVPDLLGTHRGLA
jgi:hypothetical protein